MTRSEVEQVKGHFDKVMDGLRTDLRTEFQSGLGGLGAELRSEFRAGLDGLGADLRQEMTGLGAELRQEMAGLGTDLRQEIAEVRHYTGVVAEDLRSEIRNVADGVALANGRISDVDLRVDALTTEVRRGFAAVRGELHRLHETDDELRRRIDAPGSPGA